MSNPKMLSVGLALNLTVSRSVLNPLIFHSISSQSDYETLFANLTLQSIEPAAPETRSNSDSVGLLCDGSRD